MISKFTHKQTVAMENALHEALKKYGTQTKIAEMVGITQPQISHYYRGAVINGEHAVRMENKLGIKKEILRPDLFY